jgi:TRAP-type C4-dicarboxylate transport system permease small subunit
VSRRAEGLLATRIAPLPGGVRRGLDRCWEFVFALAWAALGLRMLDGAIEVHANAQATMLLRVPGWLVYIPALLGVVLSLLAAVQNTVSRTDRDPGLTA